MKCIKKDGKIKRVRDQEARKLVEDNGWIFIPKKEWKSSKIKK
jgi:hypothetical protein